MAVLVARFLAAGLRRLGLWGLAWLIEARGLANRSEGLGWPGPVDKIDGFGLAGRAQGPVDKCEGFGWSRREPHAPSCVGSNLVLTHVFRDELMHFLLIVIRQTALPIGIVA